MNFVEQCRKIISIDTSPSSSSAELVDYLADLSSSFGLYPEVLTEVHNGITQANIIVRSEPFKPGDREFLLQTHLDTVDPDNFSLWKKNDFNPFGAVIEDGKIFGLGSADVKLDFLCKLYTLKTFKGRKFGSLKPVLIGTFGEETGMHGALKLIRKNKINAQYAVIGEPTDMTVVNAAKGFAVVEIKIPISQEERRYKESRMSSESASTETKLFTGKSTHSSTPHLGDNAIQKVLEFLFKMPNNMVLVDADGGTRFNMVPSQAMIELDFTAAVTENSIAKIKRIYQAMLEVEIQMKRFEDRDFEPHHSTFSVGIIRTYEDHIKIGGSCRILPNINQDQYEQWMKHIAETCDSVGAQFSITDYKKPFRTNENSVLIKNAQKILEKMGYDSKCRSLASTNEASLFSRLGIECICIGAGVREGNVHTANEHVKIADLEKSIQFYEQLVERFCL